MLYMAIIELKSVQQDAKIAFLFSAMGLLYMFRVTISPITKSTYAVYGHYCGEISPTRCNKCVFILSNVFTLHVSGDNFTHHQEYNTVYGHYSGEMSPTRCNKCVFILRNGSTLHVSCDNFTHHQEYNAVYGHFSGEISPTRCNNCVFILRNGFSLHVSVSVSPIIRSTMLYMAIIVVK